MYIVILIMDANIVETFGFLQVEGVGMGHFHKNKVSGFSVENLVFISGPQMLSRIPHYVL